jgi:hypothetical protein
VPASEPVVYRSPTPPNARHLADWLEKHKGAARVVIELAGDLNLSSKDSGVEGLVVRARQHVTIRAKDPGSMPTIRYRYDPKPTAPALVVALAVHCPAATVQGVRFIIDKSGSADAEMVGLLLEGGTRYQVQGCEFIQAQPSFTNETKRLASVVAVADRGGSALELQECCFLGFEKVLTGDSEKASASDQVFSGVDPGGQDAVVRQGPVQVTAEHCAFGPHLSAFRLEGGEEDTAVTVRRCSVLLPRRSAVLDLPPRACARLDVSHSLFSRLDGSAALNEGDSAVLLRQAEEPGTVSYRGKDNRYHDLDGYWAVGKGWETASWSDFTRNELGEGQDEKSRVLLSNPWAVTPEQQRSLLEKLEVTDAFQVNTRLKAVRQLGTSTPSVVGVARLLGQPCVPDTLPPLDPKADLAGGRVLVVEPNDDSPNLGGIVYPSLNAAIVGCRAGDTILIRHNGELEVDPIRLANKGLCDLTIRPFRRFRPVLTLNRETPELDTALFRVHDGTLRLSGLGIRLRPSKGKSEARVQAAAAVVAFLGDGDCLLKDCVITLDRAKQDTTLALASVNVAVPVMRLGSPVSGRDRSQGPRLSLDNCFVRGDGDLLWSRTGRPCELSATQTLAALRGSLINVEVPADAAAVEGGLKVDVSLTRVTTYLGGHLIRLSAGKDLKGLVPPWCKPANCVFLPGPDPRSLVHLDGPDTDEKGLQEKLKWKGEGNAYGAYTTLFDQQPPGDAMPSPPMNKEKWQNFSGDTTSTYDARLESPPPADAPYAELKVEDFRLPSGSAKRGANLDRLPAPAR